MYYRVAGSDSEGVFFGLAVDPGRQSLAKGSAALCSTPPIPSTRSGLRLGFGISGLVTDRTTVRTRALVVTACRIHFGAFKLGDPAMCGTIACRTNGPAIDYLRIGLRRLEYRGYHSVGVAVQNHRR